eukprot:1096642-Amphidinium_carterae.2
MGIGALSSGLCESRKLWGNSDTNYVIRPQMLLLTLSGPRGTRCHQRQRKGNNKELPIQHVPMGVSYKLMLVWPCAEMYQCHGGVAPSDSNNAAS